MKVSHVVRDITVTLELSEKEANVLYDICAEVAGEDVAYDVCEELEHIGLGGTGREVDESCLRKGCDFVLRFLPKEKEEE